MRNNRQFDFWSVQFNEEIVHKKENSNTCIYRQLGCGKGLSLFDDYNPFNGIKVGEARIPGPREGFILEVANVSHLLNQSSSITNRKFHAMICGEHSLVPHQFHEVREKLGRNMFCDLSKLVPDTVHQLGGVGIVVRGKRPIKPKIISKNLEQISDKGRFALYGIEPFANTIIPTYYYYGKTGGDLDTRIAQQTDNALQCIFEDANLQLPGPKIICGDFNCSLANLPDTKLCMELYGFVNLGSIASSFGGIDDEYTCVANAYCAHNIRDYILVNQEALDMIQKFSIDHDSGLPVHSVLCVEFKACADKVEYEKVTLPKSLMSVFLNQCQLAYDHINFQAKQAKALEKLNLDKKIVFGIKLPESEIKATNHNKSMGLAPNVVEVIDEEKANLKELFIEDEFIDKTIYTVDQKQQQLDCLHSHMDPLVDANLLRFKHFSDTKDAEAYIKLVAKLVEEAFCSYGKLDQHQASDIKGRAKVNVSKGKNKIVVDVMEDNEVMFNISSQSMHILKQIRRLDKIKACVAKIVGLKKGQLDVVNSEVGLNLEIKGNVKAFVKGFAKGDPNPDSLDYFRSKSDAEDISYFSVVKLAENYRKHLAGLRKASATVTNAKIDNTYKGN